MLPEFRSDRTVLCGKNGIPAFFRLIHDLNVDNIADGGIASVEEQNQLIRAGLRPEDGSGIHIHDVRMKMNRTASQNVICILQFPLFRCFRINPHAC